MVDQVELDRALAEGEDDFFRIWQSGPEITRWDSLPVQVGDPAPGFSLPDQTGTKVTLDDLVANGPVMVLFWRHFGCGCGVDRAARLRDELADYRGDGRFGRDRWPGSPRSRPPPTPRNMTSMCPSSPIRTAPPIPGLWPPRRAPSSGGVRRAAMVVVILRARPRSDSSRNAASLDEGLSTTHGCSPASSSIDGDGTLKHTHRYQHCEDFPDPRILVTAVTEHAA